MSNVSEEEKRADDFETSRVQLARIMSFISGTGLKVVVEVSTNMPQADVDALCGENADRIIVKRTED